jgi:acyl carrier protein
VLDKQLNRVPLGAAGEVYIGGEGLARGYYNRSDLTAERFIPNPYSAGAGARLYRTGDLARYLPDGQIEVLGRIDHQVKVRGFRIELGEIEAALNGHEAVRDAVVLAREDTPQDKRIVAYVVAQSEPPRSDELQSFLREKLPEYMLPSAFVLLDALPFLPNGKIDRGALPPPESLRPELEANYTAPRDDLEQTIAAVWQEVLGAQKVGVHDNFFSDLGGHSLLVVQVVTKLRECLDPQLSFVDMFQFPTINSLAEHLRNGADWQPSSAQAEERTQQRQQAMRRRRQLKQSRLSLGTD